MAYLQGISCWTRYRPSLWPARLGHRTWDVTRGSPVLYTRCSWESKTRVAVILLPFWALQLLSEVPRTIKWQHTVKTQTQQLSANLYSKSAWFLSQLKVGEPPLTLSTLSALHVSRDFCNDHPPVGTCQLKVSWATLCFRVGGQLQTSLVKAYWQSLLIARHITIVG